MSMIVAKELADNILLKECRVSVCIQGAGKRFSLLFMRLEDG